LMKASSARELYVTDNGHENERDFLTDSQCTYNFKAHGYATFRLKEVDAEGIQNERISLS
jgi:hypothetical protein